MYHFKRETLNVPSFMPCLSSIPSTSTTIPSSVVADSKETLYTATINDASLLLRETCKECKKSFECPKEFIRRANRLDHYEWICLDCSRTCKAYRSKMARVFLCHL